MLPPPSLEGLPDEVLRLVVMSFAPSRWDAVPRLCSTMGVCRRFRDLSTDESLWMALHQQRWQHGRPEGEPPNGWRADYGRRHGLDASLTPLVRQLLVPETRTAAWKRLMEAGSDVLDAALRQYAACRTLTDSPYNRELAKVLLGLNQTDVRARWERLQRRDDLESTPVEEGALLLVAWNLSAAELVMGPDVKVRGALDELDALAARLRARLARASQTEEAAATATATAAPAAASPVQVVQTLAVMMFEEEGFCGNRQNYYDPSNSLLDQVLASRTGIPISLSVVFAAVCERVGVKLDMIGLPGHFLLATRPTAPGGERVFVDAFHDGATLDLQGCEEIVRSYGIAWSAEMSAPVPPSEVWGRMVRNLLNCHKRNGDAAQVVLHEQLLPHPPPLPVPYPSDEGARAREEQTMSHAMLQQMLQNIMQMQMQPPPN